MHRLQRLILDCIGLGAWCFRRKYELAQHAKSWPVAILCLAAFCGCWKPRDTTLAPLPEALSRGITAQCQDAETASVIEPQLQQALTNYVASICNSDVVMAEGFLHTNVELLRSQNERHGAISNHVFYGYANSPVLLAYVTRFRRLEAVGGHKAVRLWTQVISPKNTSSRNIPTEKTIIVDDVWILTEKAWKVVPDGYWQPCL